MSPTGMNNLAVYAMIISATFLLPKTGGIFFRKKFRFFSENCRFFEKIFENFPKICRFFSKNCILLWLLFSGGRFFKIFQSSEPSDSGALPLWWDEISCWHFGFLNFYEFFRIFGNFLKNFRIFFGLTISSLRNTKP